MTKLEQIHELRRSLRNDKASNFMRSLLKEGDIKGFQMFTVGALYFNAGHCKGHNAPILKKILELLR